MSREEWLDFYADQAPEITVEQWRETISILRLTRRRRGRGSPAFDDVSGSGASGAGGRDMEPPAA